MTDNFRKTLVGFEAWKDDVRGYARTREQAVAVVERDLKAKRPRTRKATPLDIGDEAAAPKAPRGRKALVCLPIDPKRSLLVTEPVKRVTLKNANAWEFHGDLAHVVAAQPPGVAHGDGRWLRLVLGKPFDDLDPAIVLAMTGPKQKAAYRQGYRSKLGGCPYFPQGRLVAACFRCNEPLDFIAQLGDSVADFMADWLRYVFLCPKGCEARVASQS